MPESSFIYQLNKIYCCQTHIFERLSEISDDPCFADVSTEISLTLLELEKHIAATEEIYLYLKFSYSFDAHVDLVFKLENDFYMVQKNSNNKRIRNAALSTYVKLVHSSIVSACHGLLGLPDNRDAKMVGFLRNSVETMLGKNLTKLLS